MTMEQDQEIAAHVEIIPTDGSAAQNRNVEVNIISAVFIVLVLLSFTPLMPYITAFAIVVAIGLLLWQFLLSRVYDEWLIDRDLRRPLTYEEQKIRNRTRADNGLPPD